MVIFQESLNSSGPEKALQDQDNKTKHKRGLISEPDDGTELGDDIIPYDETADLRGKKLSKSSHTVSILYKF